MEVALFSRLVWSEKTLLFRLKTTIQKPFKSQINKFLKHTGCVRKTKRWFECNTYCFVGKSVSNPQLFAWKSVAKSNH